MAASLAACIQEDIGADTRAWRDVLDVSSYRWDPERVTSYDFGLADNDETKVVAPLPFPQKVAEVHRFL